MVKSYELCVLFGGNSTPAEVDELAKQLEALLASAGAEIKFSHSLGRRKLAYKIAGNTHGEYRFWFFMTEPGGIPTLNQKLRLSNFVIRHLITALDEKTIEKRIQKASEVKVVKPEVFEEETQKEAEEEIVPPITVVKKEEAPRPIEPEAPARPVKEKVKVSFEELDKKLDEILENDTI